MVTPRITRKGRPRRLVAGVLAALFAATVWIPPALAHGDEDEIPAADAIRQAIALIVNDSADMEAITDRISDALASDETTGVDVALAEQAMAALEADRMLRARRLLERAIGARTDLAGIGMRPILQVPRGVVRVPLAVGLDTGTFVVTDEMPGRGQLTLADITLLVLAGLLGVAGLLLSVRLRPPDSIRALRQRARLAGAR